MPPKKAERRTGPVDPTEPEGGSSSNPIASTQPEDPLNIKSTVSADIHPQAMDTPTEEEVSSSLPISRPHLKPPPYYGGEKSTSSQGLNIRRWIIMWKIWFRTEQIPEKDYMIYPPARLRGDALTRLRGCRMAWSKMEGTRTKG
jgi:hypothetical protein